MAIICANINEQVSEQAAAVVSAMGLSLSDAVCKFIDWIAVEKRLPFEVESDAPNIETIAAINEADKILKADGARFKTPQELFSSLDRDCAN